jgi:hypothetical protein
MPDFKVIDGGGPEGRDQIFAEQKLRDCLQVSAANMLRVIRGAGKPHELIQQLNEVVKAAIKFKDAFGDWPPSHVLGEMLAMPDEVHAMDERRAQGRFTKADIDRWYEDGTMDRKYAEQAIKAGCCRRSLRNSLARPCRNTRAKPKCVMASINSSQPRRKSKRIGTRGTRPRPSKRVANASHPSRTDADHV